MPPLSILIKPASGLCNMRCKYCFYADVTDNREVKSYGIMDEKTQENMVKSALAYGDGSVNFGFQGGEPTLAGMDYFKRHIEFCKMHNKKNVAISNSIQTNGYIIDEEWAKFLAENNFLVGLSLDGDRETNDKFRIDANGKGTYSHIMDAVKWFNKYNVQYNILCVVNNYVAQNAKKIMNFFTSRGFEYLQFIACLDEFGNDIAHDYSLNEDNYAKFLNITFDKYYKSFKAGKLLSIRDFDNYLSIMLDYHAESCAANGVCSCYIVVEGDGSCFPCDFYVLDRYYLGNLNDMPLSVMQKSNTARKFVQESVYADDECKKCKYYKLCRGGCRRNREPFADGKPSLNKHCKAYKNFFDTNIEKMQEMAQELARRHGQKM